MSFRRDDDKRLESESFRIIWTKIEDLNIGLNALTVYMMTET